MPPIHCIIRNGGFLAICSGLVGMWYVLACGARAHNIKIVHHSPDRKPGDPKTPAVLSNVGTTPQKLGQKNGILATPLSPLFRKIILSSRPWLPPPSKSSKTKQSITPCRRRCSA